MSKAPFLESLLVSSFPDAFASLSYFTTLTRKSKYYTFDLIEHYIVQSMSKTIAYGVHLVTTFVSVVVVVMSGFDLC